MEYVETIHIAQSGKQRVPGKDQGTKNGKVTALKTKLAPVRKPKKGARRASGHKPDHASPKIPACRIRYPVDVFPRYNFVRINSAVRMSPAMAARIMERLWDITDIVKLTEDCALLQVEDSPPAQEGDAAPDGFNQAERPRSL